ncbi:hypothetical protein BZL30_2298 [Mycobacterium kansasii]|uniref:Uncharacterized protein n=1 Tax=Mycobacterium kansasii TaxID=1768 RepID=A0A1V3XPD3_MYCKA|nr:hypothetical protein BZL30_2298 [Mycobacterium kansasii]OOK81077.1 hypothetical protein BZL29_2283 [Mycobacterium kansasii]
MDDQGGAHLRGFGDGSQPNAEAVLTKLLDRRIPDAGCRSQVD